MDYNLHKNYIKEQDETVNVSAVISEDPLERIKDYFQNESLLEEFTSFVDDLDDDKYHQFQIENKEFGIMEGDRIMVQADMSDKNNPKFYVWVTNDELLYGDIDWDIAAGLINTAARGVGTDEDKFLGVAGAIGRIAKEKKIDPKILFDKLAETYQERYGTSLDDEIDEEFSGRAEAACLNVFRRGIPDSTMRGVTDNIANIVVDVALLALTFGGSTAVTAALKGGGAAAKGIKYAKTGSKAIKATKLGKTVSSVVSKMTKAWSKLPQAAKVARINKMAKAGKPIEYTTKSGKKIGYVVKEVITNPSGQKQIIWNTGIKGPLVENVTTFSGGTIIPQSLANLVPSAAQSGALFIGKKAADIGNNFDLPTSQSDNAGASFAEIMDYYDTLAANPTKYIASVKEQDAKSLAMNINGLKEGTGIWGNTTDQEELALALVVTSLDPEMCDKMAEQYSKIDTEMSVADVIDDELGGDLATVTNTWWAGCTGQGPMNDKVTGIYGQIKK